MTILNEPIYFIAAKRNPFGTYLGSLSNLSATDLGVHAARSALKSACLSPAVIDHVIFGNVLQTSKDALYLARHIGLRCEIPKEVPALTINRLCGSGFEAIIQGARFIATKEASCVLVGGAENMSQAPHIIRGARKGLALGASQLEDSLWESLNDTYINMPMALTAEKLGAEFNISQEEVDLFCVKSQENFQKAREAQAFSKEIEEISCGTSRKPLVLSHDEHPRAETNLATLQKLSKIFKSDGLIHAAAASGIADGACALIMCSENFLKSHKLRPLAELVSFGITGCDPARMGLGPVSAIKACLANTQKNLDDMSMIEINEAFAPQILAVKKALEIDESKLNIHGGALAIGHPLAASGARLSAHIIHALKQSGSLGIASACIGGGQGIAVMIKAS